MKSPISYTQKPFSVHFYPRDTTLSSAYVLSYASVCLTNRPSVRRDLVVLAVSRWTRVGSGLILLQAVFRTVSCITQR